MARARATRLPMIGLSCGFLLLTAGLLAWSERVAAPEQHAAPPAPSATPLIDTARSTVTLSIPRITNDGQQARVTIRLYDAHGTPLGAVPVRVDPSASYLTAPSGETDTRGRFVARIGVRPSAEHRQTSSGAVTVRVRAGAAQQLLRHTARLVVYNRVAVLLQGLGTSLRCPTSVCLPSMYAPLTQSVLRPLGYSASGAAPTILTYSYRGGVMAADGWRPAPYARCDTVQSVDRSVQALRSMLLGYRAQYPSTTFELVGHSLGGLVALKAVGDEAFLTRLGTAGIDKLIAIDAPLNGITEFDAQTWTVDVFAGIPHLLGCASQHFGVDLLGELADLGDHAPGRQRQWAMMARADGVAVLDVTNRQDLLVPEAYAAIDDGQPTSVVDRFLVDDETANTLGHGDLLYPTWGGTQTNPQWSSLTTLLRTYLRQPCLAFAPAASACRYPSIDVTR